MHAVIAHDLEEKTRTKDVILEENIHFTSLLLPDNILKGLTECGFRKPSPIQFKAIPLGRCGFDLIIKSKSGTGKTLVFSTVSLETVNTGRNLLQVLILVPTREIAVQIQDVLRNIGRFIEDLKVESFIGGLPVEDDVKKAKTCHIAVGAPGRVKHLINMGALSTEFVRLFVLDEADKLMETSFQNDINEIYNTLPQRKQMIASSATYPLELDSFLSNYMLSPTHVSSENETPILLGLKQFVSIIKTSNPNVVQLMKSKNEALVDIFSKISFTQCLVFSNYQTRAESISNYLNQKGWNSSFISAAQSQSKRLEVVNNLKDFKNRILLSTDLTSRGIDAPNVDLVINYDIPQDAVTYLHRMGRAGRYGSSGICINLALDGDELKQLQTILGTIGSTNLSISILPSLNEKSDLWHLDPNSLEQINGIEPSNNPNKVNQDIKNEIMALKQVKTTNNKRESKKKKEKKVKNETKTELNNSNCVTDILNSKEREVEEVCEKFSSVDTDTLLQSLVSGDNKFEIGEESKKRKTADLLNFVSVCDKTDSEEESKKRKKAPVREINKDLHKEKRKNDSKQITFCKNKALLSITRLLANPSLQVDPDLVNSISEYFTVLKNEEASEDFGSNSVEEILNCSEISVLETVKADPVETVEENVIEDVIEDIFTIGYECAIGRNEKNWLHCLPVEEIQKFEEFCRQQASESEEENEEDYDEDYGEEEDYEMEDYAEENEAPAAGNEQDQDIALQWIPVVQAENANDARGEYFTKCYDDCSNVLWQNGLTFETVEDFDNWFYHWQEELQSVRSYVQQNIYVEEMGKYQESRFANNK